ncbi:hypothetical protein HGG64_01160 [Mycoplasma phocoeninasale]|uniref:Uncharacterized protein n=1 Tax=Mycoplasma phocoeninasale TaxID=2726117 RepID=A0A858U2Q1_9MOLU|nr:hypothetical protein [Mycoplasma phocoeninasale]QJG66319.1 hypothetical protein HGG64_01160 [Mycoplasma phocoeninasale]
MEIKNDNNQTRKIEVNMDDIFRNPIQKFYEPLVENIKDKFDKVFKEKITNEADKALFEEYKRNEITVNSLENEILTNKKENKITARKVANGFIIAFSIVIIGLFFMSYLIKNKKIIKEFNKFASEREEKIAALLYRNNQILVQIYSRYSLQDIKDFVLKELQINKIYNYDWKELKTFIDNSKFACFYAVNKYDIRNSHYYDLLYSTLEWRNIVTYGYRTVTYKSGDSVRTITITAEHVEPTPFVTIKNATSITTNYLPDFSFVEDSSKVMTLKEYDKALKKGNFVLENPEFHRYYGFDFNDKVKMFTYFTASVQEKFIEYEKYMLSKGERTYPLSKINTNLYSSREYDNSLLFFSSIHNWLPYEINLEDRWTIEEINEALISKMIYLLKPTFKSLTKAYLNNYIASENFTELGSRYVSTYKDIKSVSKDVNINQIYWLNKIIGGRIFSLITKRADRNTIYEIIGSDFTNSTTELIVKLTSFEAHNEIDVVFKQGYSVEVPYVRYYKFSELKKTFTNQKFVLSTEGAEIYAYDDNNSHAISALGNADLNPDNDNNGITFNVQAASNFVELQKAIRIINSFYRRLPELKNNSKFLIDNYGISIHINNLDDTKVSLRMIDQVLNGII